MTFIRISAIWCTSCIITYDSWKKLEKEYPNDQFLEYDYDEDEKEIEKYQIGNLLPAILVFKNGEEQIRIIGEKTFDQIKKNLSEVKK